MARRKAYTSLSILLCLLFLIALSPVSAGELRRDGFRYEIEFPYSPTVIEGDVVDNSGKGIENASITGWAHSDNYIPIYVKTDENGYFKIVLPGGENYKYFLNINENNSGYNADHPYRGFDNHTVENTINSGGHHRLQIILNYNPFDIELRNPVTENLENSGSLTRGWVENRYNLLVTKNRIATRQVVTGYKGEAGYSEWMFSINYGKLYASQVPPYASGNASFWEQYLKEYFDTIYHSFANPLRREVVPNSFQDFTRGSKTCYLVEGYKEGEISHYCWEFWHGGLYLDSARAFREFQGFHSSWAGVPVYGGYFISPAYYVYAPRWYYALRRSDSISIPIYGTEEYTIYKNTLYEILDYTSDNWDNLQTTITATPRNGYAGDVHLAVEAEGVQAEPRENVLQFSSPAFTTLTMRPYDNTHGSTHPITIRAHDSNGRLVETRIYDLSLTTDQNPPVENTIIAQWESETKSDETGQEEITPNHALGVEGHVYNAAGQGISATINVTVSVNGGASQPAARTGNYYRYVTIGEWGAHTWNMTITASASGYREQTKYVTDTNDSSVARVDFYLAPEGPPA